MIKLAKRMIKWLVILIIVIAIFLYVLFSTPMGIYVFERVLPRVFKGLSLETITGRLGSQFVVNNVHFSNDYVDIDAKQLTLIWVPHDLLKRKLLLKHIMIDGLNIRLRTYKTESKGGYFKWKNHILLQNLDLKDVNVFYNDELKTHFNRISTVNNNDGTFHLSAQLPKGEVQGNYQLILSDTLSWRFVLVANQVDSDYLWKGTHTLLNFNLSSTGEWGEAQKVAEFSLTNLSGKVRQYSLTGQAHVRYENGRLLIQELLLNAADAKISIQGELGNQWNIIWKVDIPNLNRIYSNAYGSLISNGKVLTKNKVPIVSGYLNANNIRTSLLSLQHLSGTLSSTTRWQDPAFIRLTATNLRYKQTMISSINTNIIAKRINNSLLFNLNALFQNTNHVDGSIAFPNFFSLPKVQYINGKLNLRFPNIERFVRIPYVKAMAATMLGTLQITGPIKNPNWVANLHVDNGRLHITKLNVILDSIQFHTILRNQQPAKIIGQFRSGSGSATFESTADFFNLENQPVKLHIVGENLAVANLKEYKVFASPNVIMSYDAGVTSFSGNVYLPHARIVTKNYERMVTLPSEVVFIGQKASINYFKNLSLRLRVQLGDDIYVSYKKLTAYVTGNVFIYQNPGGLASGNGVLYITKGTYEVYNRFFSIDNGRLIYVGNLISNPGLSIRAAKQWSPSTRCFFGIEFPQANHISHLDVGVMVTGTLDNPALSLYSDPPMAQDDILSYIVFDQQRSQISGANALTLLGNLTSSMNLQGPSAVNDSEASGGGLFGIFKMGLFNPAQMLNFTLPISDHWVIQTEASVNDTGVELLYNYETD